MLGFGSREGSAKVVITEWIRAAQLLRAGPESWRQLPREIVQHLLMMALSWAEVEGRDLQISPPNNLRRDGRIPSYARLRLTELVLWGLTGLITEEERKAILAQP